MLLSSKQEALARYEAAHLGSLVLRPFAPSLLPWCSLDAPHCSLGAPPCSLAALSKAALLPFPNQNGNPQS